MPRTLNEIISHIRAVAADPSISTTLIQTEDLLALCTAAEGGTTMRAALVVARDCVMESFEHVTSTDDQVMADARLRDIDRALTANSAADKETIAAIVEAAIRKNSSPTIGRGDIHGGQAGYILYERDGLPFVAADIARAVHG